MSAGTQSMDNLERPIALTLDFLREVREDLRVAAISASADKQPRRARQLAHHEKTATDLEVDLRYAWRSTKGVDGPSASKAVATTITPDAARLHERLPESLSERSAKAFAQRQGKPSKAESSTTTSDAAMWLNRGPKPPVPFASVALTDHKAHASTIDVSYDGEGLPTLSGGGLGNTLVHRDGVALLLPAATPPAVLDFMFATAAALKLEGETAWTLDAMTRELKELAADAVHNSEDGRGQVTIAEVCDALGLSSTSKITIAGEVEECPIDQLTLLAKLRALREAFESLACAQVQATHAMVDQVQVVEDGLMVRMAERLAEIDRAWLEALIGGAS